MPPVLKLLPETDYQTMKCSRTQFFQVAQGLPAELHYYVANTTHRLAEVDWITSRLEEEVRAGNEPVAQEGLLSLQIYLLLTCADALGHTYCAGGARARFRAFFRELPQDARDKLTESLLTWKTDRAELVSLGLGNATTDSLVYPPRERVLRSVRLLSPDERLEAVVEFLYIRRNYYTHESEYPQLGHHPNLSVMQKQRLNVPSTATAGELDRLQVMSTGKDIYFTYYETDDVVAAIRWSTVRGLARVVGFV